MSVKLLTLPELTVTTPGNRVSLSAMPLMAYMVSVQSLSTNASGSKQYIGSSIVTSANGYEFGPSDVAEIEGPMIGREQDEFDLRDVYVDSTTANTKFRVVAWIKK